MRKTLDEAVEPFLLRQTRNTQDDWAGGSRMALCGSHHRGRHVRLNDCAKELSELGKCSAHFGALFVAQSPDRLGEMETAPLPPPPRPPTPSWLAAPGDG